MKFSSPFLPQSIMTQLEEQALKVSSSSSSSSTSTSTTTTTTIEEKKG